MPTDRGGDPVRGRAGTATREGADEGGTCRRLDPLRGSRPACRRPLDFRVEAFPEGAAAARGLDRVIWFIAQRRLPDGDRALRAST